MIDVITSWLRERSAYVVVGGERSAQINLKNMVYQGTVFEPPLWNVFYEDARLAINEWLFTEVMYADDLNAYREFAMNTPTDVVLKSMDCCQNELHAWGDG